MERQDSIVRAARYVVGAGTIAAVMVMMTAGDASAQTTFCFGEAPTVCGHVFTEVGDGDNAYQMEEGTQDVTVVVTDSMGNPVPGVSPSNPTTSAECVGEPNLGCGYYEFTVETPGDYQVCIVLEGQTVDCRPLTGGPNQTEDFEVPSAEEPPPSEVWGVGTGTPGYWKNHPEAWPSEGISVGGVTYLNQTAPATPPNKTIYDAIKLMGKVGGDKTVSMFAALISAKLNTTLANNTVCIVETIAKADQWMVAHPVGSGVKASSPAWSAEGADAWHTLLDDYNNGKLCAPHRN